MKTLIGIGYQNEPDRSGLTQLSMAGGAQVVIQGGLMATQPGMNLVTMTETNNLDDFAINAPPLSGK
jgi:hypothetical protein